MAAITTAGSGNWSSTTPNAPWPSGTVPTAADTVTIANTHTVTLDTTGCICLSLTVNSGGTLTNTTAANWDLTSQNDITVNSGGNMLIDMSASSYSATINLNGADATGNGYHLVVLDGGSITLKGKAKTRWTRLNGGVSASGTSITVDDATGWNTGDLICLATTSAYATTPALDLSAGTNTVSGNTVSSMTAFSYAHADRGLVGNFSSNLTIRPKTSNRPCCVFLYQTSTTSWTREIRDVVFRDFSRSTQSARDAALYVYGAGLTSPTYTAISNNAFYNNAVMSLQYILHKAALPRVNNIFYTATDSYHTIGASSTANYFAGTETGTVVFKGPIGGSALNGAFAFLDNAGKQILENCHFTGSKYAIKSQYALEMNNCSVSSCFNAVTLSAGQFFADNSDFSSNNTTTFSHNQYCDARLTDTQFAGTLNDSTFTSALDYETISLINKNASVTTQEIYRPYLVIKRDNSTTNRSTSSIAIYPTRVSTDCQRTLSIPCANGKSIRVVGYVKKSHASNIAATVAITGLGSAWGGFTAAANTDWQVWDSGNITNSSGNDGNFTLTYTANSSSGTTNVAYFDGVVDSPFVTLARHYGFTFDESNPVRKTNPYTVASEATAAAYTGVTINATTSEVSFGAGTADTFAKVYDYSQAWGCLNLDKTMPWTRAGALLSLNDGWTVLDPTITGVTWSGGTVQYNSTGGKADDLDGCIVEFNVSGGGTFTFSGTISGTLDLQNLDASAITVELPSGASYTTANNTGGTITVSTPQIYQSVTISGAVAGSRIQIYDTTSSTELYNGTPTFPYTWTDASPAAADRTIRLRCAYVSGTSAKNFIEATIGTCGQTSGTAGVSYLVSQTNDATYNSNATNGSLVTGITFTDAATDLINCNLAAGSSVWKDIYAAFVYWISTATGIADDITYIEAPDPANYLLTSMKLKNATSPSVPLVVTGGYGRDATSGLSSDIIDTSGGMIFLAPDHVTPYATGSGVTWQDKIDIASQVLTAAQATPIHSNVKQVNSLTVAGAGTEADPWGP